jgi:hypothetical protein
MMSASSSMAAEEVVLGGGAPGGATVATVPLAHCVTSAREQQLSAAPTAHQRLR